MENTELIHRLNRIQGQIAALKTMLMTQENKECLKTMQLLKAANNALKKFGEAYVSQYLEECLNKKVSKNEMEKNMKEIINATFSL